MSNRTHSVTMQWSAGSNTPVVNIRELPAFRVSTRRRAIDMSMRASAATVAVIASATAPSAHASTQAFQPTRVEKSLDDFSMTQAVKGRLSDLRLFAEEDEIVYSSVGEQRLLEFLESYEVSKRPQITLRDDGALRAFWKDNSGKEVSAKFGKAAALEIAVTIPREGRVSGNWAGYDDEDGLIDVLCGLDANDTVLG